MTDNEDGVVRIVIAALGGEGGGVLMNWIVAAARSAGMAVQATSVPGVAQRTGSTSYYIEIASARREDMVFNLNPMPGRVDVVLASELVEAGRMLSAGFVSPDRTVLIASRSRVLTTAEKSQMGDGRYADADIERAARTLAKRCHLLNLQQLAEENGTFISATMFGALAGSGVLPWPHTTSEEVVANHTANRDGFLAASAAVGSADADVSETSTDQADRWANMADALRDLVEQGRQRVREYQDVAYGELFSQRLDRLMAGAGTRTARTVATLSEATRRLALWMTYEDIARVAELKTRPERFAKIRREAKLQPGQLLTVSEYLKPRAEEIADLLPPALARWILRRSEKGLASPMLGKGRVVGSNTVTGFYLLRLIASLKCVRRRSYRFQREQLEIEQWLDLLVDSLISAPALALVLAELPRVLKGYSDTHVRGRNAYARILDEIVRPALAGGDGDAYAATLRSALDAALADEQHAALDELMAGNNEQRVEFARAHQPAGN